MAPLLLLAPDASGFPAVATVTDVDKISPHNCVSTDSWVPVVDGDPLMFRLSFVLLSVLPLLLFLLLFFLKWVHLALTRVSIVVPFLLLLTSLPCVSIVFVAGVPAVDGSLFCCGFPTVAGVPDAANVLSVANVSVVAGEPAIDVVPAIAFIPGLAVVVANQTFMLETIGLQL